jgi:aromatic-amino-acid transaminase
MLESVTYSSGFAGLKPQAPDPLLSLIKACGDDPRPFKIDLGVGVYRNDDGETPVLQSVKDAEAHLHRQQKTKTYLGPEGDTEFLALIRPVIFGEAAGANTDLFAMQTPGGTGALRIAAEIAKAARPDARVWLGTPGWPVHSTIFAAVGLAVATYRYFDVASQELTFGTMMSALGRAAPGDFVLLQGSCHNPSGVDLTPLQWHAIANHCAARGLIPLIDLAYQGLGDGFEHDACGARILFDAVDDAMLAYSCDKNFALYRERTGALFVRSKRHLELVRSNALALARPAWSMSPDHGAAVVRIILESAELTSRWQGEVELMRSRINAVRRSLAQADDRLRPLLDQRGLFSTLRLSPDQIETLRRDHAVYMVPSGRINIAGLTSASVPQFVEALRTCMGPSS